VFSHAYLTTPTSTCASPDLFPLLLPFLVPQLNFPWPVLKSFFVSPSPSRPPLSPFLRRSLHIFRWNSLPRSLLLKPSSPSFIPPPVLPRPEAFNPLSCCFSVVCLRPLSLLFFLNKTHLVGMIDIRGFGFRTGVCSSPSFHPVSSLLFPSLLLKNGTTRGHHVCLHYREVVYLPSNPFIDVGCQA